MSMSVAPPEVHLRTVHALTRAIDARDGFIHLHSERVGFYGAALSTSVGLEPARVEMIRTAGRLHAVGTIGIRDAILFKPGRLTEDEFAVMRHAPGLARDILSEGGMPEVASWVSHMHERIDGRGYPDGLAGDEIPIESRILHLADALDALTSPRLYRREMTIEEALVELERHAGSQFDARIAGVLTALVRGGAVIVGEQPGIGRPPPGRAASEGLAPSLG